jgi:hypothetical protein
VPLGEEPVAASELRRRGGAAELRLLDRSAAQADEVMVMAGLAAHVGRARVAGERADRSGSTQELDGSINGREAELGRSAPGLFEEVEGGEASRPIGDQIEQGATLGRQASSTGEAEAAIFGDLFSRSMSHGQMIVILTFR